ncbi:MAG: hypothetical protein Q9M36_15195 [Sulfurovum sp.]|nr:hypothetical protein [Sulfurovum sp.]
MNKKEYEKAESYYLKAIESGDNDALNNLGVLYFIQAKNINEALSLVQKSDNYQNDLDSRHTLATVLLWKEDFTQSYEKFIEFLEYDGSLEFEEDIILYLTLLISKGQYYKAKEFMEMPKYQLKERYKSIWYALMTFMQEDFPHEGKKMGGELAESVAEVLVEIERLGVKYAIA